MRSSWSEVLPIVLLLSACGLHRPADVESDEAAVEAGLHGRISWTGPLPDTPPDADVPEPCRPVREQRLAVGAEGGLAGVFVRIPAVAASEAAPDHLRLEARGCAFEPATSVVASEVTLEVANGDGAVLHTFHMRNPDAGRRSIQVLAVPPGTPPLRHRVADDVVVVSDQWPWMRAAIYVAGDVRWTVTDAGGRFAFPDLAPGRWTVEMLHPAVGMVTEVVDVPEDGPASLYSTWPSD